jgi:hypothetical protein
MDANLNAINQRMLTDAEAELSRQEWNRAEVNRDLLIAQGNAEALTKHYETHIANGTYDAETANAQFQLDLGRIEQGKADAQKEALWNIATQQATDEQGNVQWSDVLSFLNQPKNTQGVSSGDVDGLIENAETQLRIQNATRDPDTYWGLLRRISRDAKSVPEEEIAGQVNSGKLTTDDYKELMRLKDTENDPLKSPRALIRFSELDKLYKDGAVNTLEYDVMNERLTNFFRNNPDATAKQADEFFNELTKQEKSDWVWSLLTAPVRYSTAGLMWQTGKHVWSKSPLNSDEEARFQKWYARWAKKTGIHPDPDHPEHDYDYRAAYRAGAEPKISKEDNKYHWDSKYKDDDHPNRYVRGIDTITGKPLPTPTTQAEYDALAVGTRYIHPEHGERVKR